MKGKVFLAVVVLMCLALVAQSALAGGGMMRGGGRGGMYEGLDLTKEQQAKIAKIREEIMEKARNADSSEARREIFGQMREKMQSVLTKEQREKMAQRFSDRPGREGDRPGRPSRRPGQDAAPRTRSMGPIQVLDGLLRRLELNEEQRKKIAKIREEAIKKLFKDVKAVLTKEQNTRLGEAQKRLRAAQQRRTTEARPGAGRPSERRDRGEGDREGREGREGRERGSRRGGGDREGGARGGTRGEGGRER